jgi:iron complex transport system substrate-binding protein
MNTPSRRIGAFATTFALCALAACGSGSDSTTGNTDVPAASEAPAAPISEAPAETVPVDIVPAETEPEVTVPEDDATAPSGPRIIEHAYGSTEVPASPERIVALSEEFLLADLVALGVTPVASSSNDASGFGGIGPALTEGIEILTSASFNIEQLAAFRPDMIVAYPVYIELVGYDALNAVAPTVAIGEDGSDWRERLQLTADVLGVEELGAARIAEYQAAHDAAGDVLGGVPMSATSIFDPSFIRADTDGGTFLVDVMVDAGVELVPAAADIDGVDAVGRVQLSLEQLEVLQGDVLLLLQRLGVEDEGAAAVTESPLWATLPAVQGNAVITLDRLAYPGAAGAASFVTELAAAVSALS